MEKNEVIKNNRTIKVCEYILELKALGYMNIANEFDPWLLITDKQIKRHLSFEEDMDRLTGANRSSVIRLRLRSYFTLLSMMSLKERESAVLMSEQENI